MIKFIINLFVVIYVIAGLCFASAGAFAGAAYHKIGFSVSLLEIIYNYGLSILFFGMAIMLNKRRMFIIKWILTVQLISFLAMPAILVGMLIDKESLIHKIPSYYISWLSFWSVLFLFPIWFFTRPKVKEQFK